MDYIKKLSAGGRSESGEVEACERGGKKNPSICTKSKQRLWRASVFI